ncbi:MAG: hypothetical protein J7527_14185 [Chitinophagaceae bacterium]|nr:hypothetical protein [Chitinophagaceae bacterium]
MKILFLLSFVVFEVTAVAQSPCDNVRLYDQMTVRTDRPILQRLKPFDVKSIPIETRNKIKVTMEQNTSSKFASALKIRSVRLFDSLQSRYWVQMNSPIIDRSTGDTIDLFYAVLYETLLPDQTKFLFRVDFQQNGKLVDEDQLAFYNGDDLHIKSCKDVIAIVMADTIQPIRAIEYMSLVYNSNDMIIRWTVVAKQDSKTGTKYFKEVDARAGDIMLRGDFNVTEPLREARIENGR